MCTLYNLKCIIIYVSYFKEENKMDISKMAKDLDYILETKKVLDSALQSKMITKDQYTKALNDLMKPYK